MDAMDTENVMVAEAALLAARATADKERREAAMDEVLRLKARLMELKPKLEEAAYNTLTSTNMRLKLHFDIVDARAQISHWSAPLDVDTFLTKQELEKRAVQVKRWQARYDQHLAEYAKVSAYEGRTRREALEMDAEYRALGYQFRNYLAIADGGEPGNPNIEGGLSEVDADFLTVPGSPEGYPAVTVRAPGMREIMADGTDAPSVKRGVWERL
jgi:hypothetical protein